MYIEKITAPAHANRKWRKSSRKNKDPIMLPNVKTTKTTHKTPPYIVKSQRVWKAKIVRAITIAAVRPTA